MSDQQPAEPAVEELDVRETLPSPLVPLYDGWQAFEETRAAHGETYVGALEAITAAILIGGYLYWLYLFFVVG